MIVNTSIGISVDVGEDGRFNLPQREYTTTDLKKITRDINRSCRRQLIEAEMEGMDYDE